MMEEAPQADQDPEPGPRVWTAFVAWAVALAASVGLYLSAGTIAVIVQQAGPRFFGLAPIDPKAFSITSTPAFVLFIATCTSAEYLGLALVLAALSPRPWRARLRLQPSQAGIGAYLVAATAYFALCECADVVGYACDWKEGVFARTVVDAGPAAMIYGVVVIGVISSLGMELLYCGYVQSRLVERWGRWPGILVTSVLAGVSFLDLRHGLFGCASAVFVGWVVERCRSVRPAIVASLVNSTVWLLTIGVVRNASLTMDLVLLVAFVLVALAAIPLLRHLTPEA